MLVGVTEFKNTAYIDKEKVQKGEEQKWITLWPDLVPKQFLSLNKPFQIFLIT